MQLRPLLRMVARAVPLAASRGDAAVPKDRLIALNQQAADGDHGRT
jgi:hypothetical protein